MDSRTFAEARNTEFDGIEHFRLVGNGSTATLEISGRDLGGQKTRATFQANRAQIADIRRALDELESTMIEAGGSLAPAPGALDTKGVAAWRAVENADTCPLTDVAALKVGDLAIITVDDVPYYDRIEAIEPGDDWTAITFRHLAEQSVPTIMKLPARVSR